MRCALVLRAAIPGPAEKLGPTAFSLSSPFKQLNRYRLARHTPGTSGGSQ
jgi:hypothetical protein